jgi:flagellar basal body-associated protein FliL
MEADNSINFLIFLIIAIVIIILAIIFYYYMVSNSVQTNVTIVGYKILNQSGLG